MRRGTTNDHFILGASLTPFTGPQPRSPFNEVDFNALPMPKPASGDDWSCPQLIMGYQNGKLVAKLEHYEGGKGAVLTKEVDLQSAVDYLLNLHVKFKIIDVYNQQVSIARGPYRL